jgi:hypothetical protein
LIDLYSLIETGFVVGVHHAHCVTQVKPACHVLAALFT